MGWASGTEIMDAAVSAMTKTAAEVFQVAAGLEHARTPALGNWLNESPENRAKLDDMMRRGVAQVAKELRKRGWDCIEEADAFSRFPQEMLGYDDAEYREHLERRLADVTQMGEPEEVLAAAQALRAHNHKTKAGNA